MIVAREHPQVAHDLAHAIEPDPRVLDGIRPDRRRATAGADPRREGIVMGD